METSRVDFTESDSDEREEPAERKVVAECFCGSGNLTRALEVYFEAYKYDLQIDVDHDFSKWIKVEQIAHFLMAHACCYVHFAPPCNSYSNARYPKIRTGSRVLVFREAQLFSKRIQPRAAVITEIAKILRRRIANTINPRVRLGFSSALLCSTMFKL